MFIEAKDDGGGGDNWTTAAISRAKLQSNHQETNIQFLQAGCPSCHPTNSVKTLKGKISHSMDLLTPSSPGGLPTLSLTTNSSRLPWGGLPCLSSAPDASTPGLTLSGLVKLSANMYIHAQSNVQYNFITRRAQAARACTFNNSRTFLWRLPNAFMQLLSKFLYNWLFSDDLCKTDNANFENVGVEAANDAQTVWVNTACRNNHSQKNLSKSILQYCNVYNQIASDVCRNQ